MREGSGGEMPSRRAALAALGAGAVGLAMAGCGSFGTLPGDGGEAPGTAKGSSAAPSSTPLRTTEAEVPTAAPVVAPAPAPSFASDFTVPPIRGGLVPVITRITTAQPVVFLTIDDGITKRPEAIALLKAHGYPVTMFLTKNFVQDQPDYFRDLMREGDFVENHTVSHDTQMWSKSYAYQLAEITGMQDYAQTTYGRRPTLFRPPGGAYSATMRKACADAGLKAIVDWEAKSNAGHMDYQAGNALRPGDIVLMHFRPEFASDLDAFRSAQLSAGLTVVSLERFIGAE
ncbi:polysaccharide deacetylase family protein [Sinomonas susongensis]|uniref:polysaccharide deacetylase family protein n=1 Tax=Sinomonas susongensis TaxID=1324851 RepID=UPI001FE540CF|nr:polysaccharide deacetylase family protein [Sinomonas susongensis]